MGQILFTKNYGEIEIEKSWAKGTAHIAKLVGGAYVHISGLPVQSKAELREVITDPQELAQALDWFDHRHDEPEKEPRRLILNPDGTMIFDDGTPVTSVSEIVEAIKPGPLLDAALLSFAKQQEKEKKAQAAAKRPGGRAGKKVSQGSKKTSKPTTKEAPPKPAPQPEATA
ncbi:MAG: hypothetical protein AB1491_00120 [Thermodesulfobacteriota bacterium]